MNERIQQIEMQVAASFDPLKEYSTQEYTDEFNKRFAMLIVRECAVIASRAESSDTELRCMYDVITEHFGLY